jgi:tellurite resistance protein TerC
LALWIAFNAVVLALLALDLFVFHRSAHEVRFREAAAWSAFWIVLSLCFAAGVYYFRGHEDGLEFLTGYLIEKALSVDNIFVFVLVFSYFRVPPAYQHRVLFWGILAALVMRGAMIGAGVFLIERWAWITYVFGALLVITAIRMAMHDEQDIHVESNPVIRLVRRFLPVSNDYHGQRFFIREERGGRMRLVATPMLIVLAAIETTDLIFALDSIPAIFAITHDPFIVYTSNVCAILGLRALYFLLSGVINTFRWLKLGLSVVLVFVGLKMLLEEVIHVPIAMSLAVIGSLLVVSIVASLIWPAPVTDDPPLPPEKAPPLGSVPPDEEDVR